METGFCSWVLAVTMCCWLLLLSRVCSGGNLNGVGKVRGVNLGGWLVVEGWIKPSLFDGIPNGDMLDGTQVQFKSMALQKYVSAENGGGQAVTVDRDVPLSWETFRLWRVSETEFQFRSLGGQFLTCDAEGDSVTATAESPSMKETFSVERNSDNRIHIKLKSGTYLQEHRNNFIKQEDFIFLYRHGINTVRIPVGWWIAQDPNPPPPFIGGSLAALDNAFSWAQMYDIRCIIDLHAAPGSQNGMEHSSSRDGSVDWPRYPDYISQSLDVIDFLASRYANHPALLGIELLNEPSASSVPLDVLISYYSKGYQIVRKYSSSAYVIICQRIGNADPLELYRANIGFSNIVVDLHYYNLFDPFFINMSAVDNIDFIFKSRQTQLQVLNKANGPLVFIGEWVNEWNVMSGSQVDYQNFGRAQLEVYDTASFGWAYWTLKNDRKHWDFEWNIKKKYLQLGDSSKQKISSGAWWFALAYWCLNSHYIY
ncbi:probable glucan 1,3-beta-glucosidase A isoform X2 [Telopea speciosissima]|uniref:probable glucan 1,3-beta-glucosidase A isoform X2 n=1 Tax=Telopea speciosissima TaxID=54955 RepID=UPI001CC3ED99|nr:probable glucan 1,3-beta-glucosidase A isoform X2 [Telopea speciosissima]